jgi:hypothetical protein
MKRERKKSRRLGTEGKEEQKRKKRGGRTEESAPASREGQGNVRRAEIGIHMRPWADRNADRQKRAGRR